MDRDERKLINEAKAQAGESITDLTAADAEVDRLCREAAQREHQRRQGQAPPRTEEEAKQARRQELQRIADAQAARDEAALELAAAEEKARAAAKALLGLPNREIEGSQKKPGFPPPFYCPIGIYRAVWPIFKFSKPKNRLFT